MDMMFGVFIGVFALLGVLTLTLYGLAAWVVKQFEGKDDWS